MKGSVCCEMCRWMFGLWGLWWWRWLMENRRISVKHPWLPWRGCETSRHPPYATFIRYEQIKTEYNKMSQSYGSGVMLYLYTHCLIWHHLSCFTAGVPRAEGFPGPDVDSRSAGTSECHRSSGASFPPAGQLSSVSGASSGAVPQAHVSLLKISLPPALTASHGDPRGLLAVLDALKSDKNNQWRSTFFPKGSGYWWLRRELYTVEQLFPSVLLVLKQQCLKKKMTGHVFVKKCHWILWKTSAKLEHLHTFSVRKWAF